MCTILILIPVTGRIMVSPSSVHPSGVSVNFWFPLYISENWVTVTVIELRLKTVQMHLHTKFGEARQVMAAILFVVYMVFAQYLEK